jgi:hypothetical protein
MMWLRRAMAKSRRAPGDPAVELLAVRVGEDLWAGGQC